MIGRLSLVLFLSCAAFLGCDRGEAGRVDVKGAARGGELPELGRITEFSLVDQSGRAVTQDTFSGKVWAAAFMFTRCPTVCPEITRRMKSVQERAQARKLPLSLVSFSVDPDNDTPEVLSKYAHEYGASLDSWSFLTGPFELVAATAEKGFKIAVERGPGAEAHGGITHGSHLVLVDQRGAIRGYYRTTEDEALERLLLDAAALTKRP